MSTSANVLNKAVQMVGATGVDVSLMSMDAMHDMANAMNYQMCKLGYGRMFTPRTESAEELAFRAEAAELAALDKHQFGNPFVSW